MKTEIVKMIERALKTLGMESVDFVVEHPEDLKNGDYSTNVALILSKREKKNPKELAEKIASELSKGTFDMIEKIEVAGAGFINFHLSSQFFKDSIKEISENESFGKTDKLKGEKVMVEYTDPNPFKEFHIGHLMQNTIGEAISRIVVWNGAELKRACYQGDVGIHVASAVWGLVKNGADPDNLSIKELGKAYSSGAQAYKNDDTVKKEIDVLNKVIYEKSDEKIDNLYQAGRKLSLEYFETIYKKLGTKFDFYFFESEVGGFGKEIVEEFLEKGIFEKSDGAIVFHGEKYEPTLHTRVFINSHGLPTYESKELGLAKIKYDKYKYTKSIIVTGNEVNDYFKVLMGAMKLVFPELAEKTKHISHGMLRLPTGKMSSRTGEVVTGESLLSEIGEKVAEIVKESGRGEMTEEFINQVSVAALKYSILKQAIGRDIIFDFEKSVSFEGDSGPYLQYSYARAKSVLEKAKELKVESQKPKATETVSEMERMLYRFPEVVESALLEYSPQYISTYLIELARSFNAYYAENKIIDSSDPTSLYKVMQTRAFSTVIKNGLTILGISTPEKM